MQLALSVALALLPFHDRGGPAQGAGPPSAEQRAAGPTAESALLVDGPITPWQSELLALAQRAADAVPTHPHAKTRARLQEEVLDAALVLDQPSFALRQAGGIDNWRRAVGHAKVAIHAAERGCAADARRLAERARTDMEAEVAEGGTRYESLQEWMGERVNAMLARVHLVLGEREQAERLVAAVGPAELGAFAAARIARVEQDRIDVELKTLESRLESGGLDAVRGATEVGTGLYDRLHGDPERRGRVAEALAAAASHVPLDVHVRLAARLAEIDLSHGDVDGARARLAEARARLGDPKIRARDLLPLVATLARVRHRAGDEAEALSDLAAALGGFESALDRTPDVFRARVLRTAAEAYQSMGETERARATYLAALEAGTLNPNARPRAEDLVATCCSLATAGVAPDAALRERIVRALADLRDPW